MLSRVPSIHDRCGATSIPVSLFVLVTVSMVPERVVPPAPKVTEKNAGPSDASGPRAAVRFSSPAGVLGGNNSTLKTFGCFCWLCICMNYFPHPPNQTDRLSLQARCASATTAEATTGPKPGGERHGTTCLRE